MKRVFLYAYDKINLGDDLFIHCITRRYPGVMFYLWTDIKNKITFQNIPNLKILDKDARSVHILNKIRGSFSVRYKNWWEKRCNASVYIGGSIFMEYGTWRNQTTWLEYQAENRKFFILGANFGPYKTEAYREKLNEVFLKMEDVCFRDKYSQNKFIGNSKVRYAPDILLSYTMPRRSIKKKQIFVSVIDCAGRDDIKIYEKSYIGNMTKILKRYLDEGCSVILASFCKEEGDEKAIQNLSLTLDYSSGSKIETIGYNGTNAELVLGKLAESEYVIASRFHATILAMAAERPVLPVIYSDKTLHILEDMKFEGVTFDLRKNKNWDYMRSRKNWDHPVELLNGDFKVASENHFKKLDRLLRD